MLIKRNDTMTFVAQPVKKMTGSVLAILAICTTSMAPAAFAGETPFTESVVTAKFKLSDLQDQAGTEKVYSKLKKRAKAVCRSDSLTLQYFGQSVSECTADLVDQFIQSADIEVLKTYHSMQQAAQAATQQSAQAGTMTLALNKG